MGKEIIKSDFFIEYQSEQDLEPKDAELLKKAREAALTSYSPYSNFQVGAAIRLEDNQIILGSNQENAAYPSGLCAERVALFSIGANFPDKKIKQIAVAAKRKEDTTYLPVTPCGGCRQVMIEFEHKQNQPIEFIMRSGKQSWIKTRSCEVLLPFSFDKNSL